MAPTEILAKQHFETISKILLPMGISVALLTHNWQKANAEEVDSKIIIAKIKKMKLKLLSARTL